MRVDPDTIQRAQAGDHTALSAIMEATYSYVKGFAVRRASNYDYAEEATAETYLTMLIHIGRYEDRGKIEQWLCAIARHHLSHIERRERYRAGPSVHPDMAYADDIEQQVVDRLGAQQARNVLAILSPYQRAILELRFVQGLDTQDTAAVLGVPPRSVAYAAYRGLKELRARIRDEAHYHTRPDAVLAPARRNNSGKQRTIGGQGKRCTPNS